MNPGDSNINYDFPPELQSWIHSEFGLWPAAFLELPDAAILGVVQQWLLVKKRIGCEIRYTNKFFHCTIYTLENCVVDNVYNHNIDHEDFMTAWTLGLVYAVSAVQEWEQARHNKHTQYYGNQSFA